MPIPSAAERPDLYDDSDSRPGPGTYPESQKAEMNGIADRCAAAAAVIRTKRSRRRLDEAQAG
jgi:hypothetical protein